MTTDLDPELIAEIRRIATTPILLVGSDYDGTLSPISDNPARAYPINESIIALRSLANLPSTLVAVVSGRALRDLATLSRLPAEVHLVGSHGSEFDLGFISDLSDEAMERLSRLRQEAEQIRRQWGCRLEFKPASIAIHTRGLDPHARAAVQDAVTSGPAMWKDVFVTHGKEVIELSVIETSKGSAFNYLRQHHGATAALFVGDDLTDEKVFAELTGPDFGIKVGDEETLAGFRVSDPLDVARILAMLAEERQKWLAGANAVEIQDHALLSDGFNVALLTPNGRVTWMSYPEVDDGALFADLLGGPQAGHFSIEPLSGGKPLGQTYVFNTMTVRTRWAGLTTHDYLDRTHRHRDGNITRLVRVISARVPVKITFAPRPHFGSVRTRIQVCDEGLRVEGAADPVVLRCPQVTWEIQREGIHDTAIGILEPQDFDIVVELRTGTDDLSADPMPEVDRRDDNHSHWREWVQTLTVPRHYQSEVIRSALTLKALCHEQTGAILAAATTSLPEGFGGIRNWDYRYCWIRDAAMTAHALLNVGSTIEAQSFLSWLHIVVATSPSPEHIRPLYSIRGTTLGPEGVIESLPGYAGSRPVRVGNAAQGQVQLDVFGPVVALIADLAHHRGRITQDDLWVTKVFMNAVRRRWQEPDNGIWEIRDEPKHHVHSRVMCWQTITSGIKVLELVGEDTSEWHILQQQIQQDILDSGWSNTRGSFVAAYDRDELDASALHVLLNGLLDQSDPRFISTVNAVEAGLRVGHTVLRYTYDDGLPGREGGMTICTSWLIECYVAAGLIDQAQELFDQVLACAGPTGLLAEQVDVGSERGMGNHPQAYSHLGIIRCALSLAGALD